MLFIVDDLFLQTRSGVEKTTVLLSRRHCTQSWNVENRTVNGDIFDILITRASVSPLATPIKMDQIHDVALSLVCWARSPQRRI